MRAMKRVRWKLVAIGAAFLAWVVIRTLVWHPPVDDTVADIGGLMAFTVTATYAVRRPEPTGLKDWRAKRQNLELKAQFADHEVKAYKKFNDLEDRLAGIEQGIASLGPVTGQPPPGVTADGPTQPIYLKDRRKTG